MVAMRKGLTRGRKILLAVVGALVAISLAMAYGFNNLNPILISMAEARARQLAVETINRAVSNVMGTSLTYVDLVTVITDETGRVTMIQANTMLMNELASKAALAAQKNLGELADQGVRLPLGAAFGIGLFSGSGPDINVRVVPVGSVTTQFVTAFESAGINQTRHEILLETNTLMRIVIPSGANTINVTNYVPIAESIIVGQVPDTFISVDDTDQMLNLVP